MVLNNNDQLTFSKVQMLVGVKATTCRVQSSFPLKLMTVVNYTVNVVPSISLINYRLNLNSGAAA